MSNLHLNKDGITLVALVITIIVILILAGITISLTVGQRGILTRAQEAGRNYEEAAKKEEEDLANFLEEVDNIIAGTNTPNDDNYTMVDGIPVPKGFEHVEGTTKEEGFVIKDISVDEKGNLTDSNGNEFVWIPCTEDGENESIKYDRYAFSRDGWSYSQTKNEETGGITRADFSSYVFTETMPIIQGNKTELDSIKEYGGFYIGRYEVGIVGYDEEVKTENSSNEAEWTGYRGGRAVVQKGKQVWNYITRDMAKKIAEGMYTNNGVVISRLCSSYAWDTALQFIETKNEGYATNSVQGNYQDTTFMYTDLNGNMQTKAKDTTTLVPTGQTMPVNNIYDMGGNVWEWTTERRSDSSEAGSDRGGRCANDAGTSPAGSRGIQIMTDAYDFLGFRITLFVKL